MPGAAAPYAKRRRVTEPETFKPQGEEMTNGEARQGIRRPSHQCLLRENKA
jgi:hypothetical protein